MAARRPTSVALVVVLPIIVALAGACSSDKNLSTDEAGPSTPTLVPTTFGLPTTTIRTTTTVPQTTVAPTTIEPTTTVQETTTTAVETTVPVTEAPTTVPPPPLCPGITTLPPNVDTTGQITGNVDGDAIDDFVTVYTGDDGAAHVFLQRGSGGGSDVAVQLGFSNAISISFEDFDYSLGAVTPAPKVILAIGAGPAGSAFATFLSPDRSEGACLQQWQLDGQPFTFTIDQRGPYSGLMCDRAAGNVYYVLRTATPTEVPATVTTLVANESTTSAAPVISITTTAHQIDHNGPVVTLTELGGETFPDDGSAKKKYGDIVNCDHPPLFP